MNVPRHHEHCFPNFAQQITPLARACIVVLEEFGVRMITESDWRIS
jgi:hypothetical protein